MTDAQGATNELNDLLGEVKAFVETLQSATDEGASVEQVLQFESSKGATGGVMGVRVETGIGGTTATVRETVESVQPEASEETAEVRRPAVDVYEQEQRICVEAEMPGIGKEDLEVTVEADALVLAAETDQRQYWRAVSLPGPVATDEYTVRAQNGLVELVFSREESEHDDAGD